MSKIATIYGKMNIHWLILHICKFICLKSPCLTLIVWLPIFRGFLLGCGLWVWIDLWSGIWSAVALPLLPATSGKSLSTCRGLAKLESTCQPCKPLFSCRLRTHKCNGFARVASDTVKWQVIQQSSKWHSQTAHDITNSNTNNNSCYNWVISKEHII